MKQYGARAHWVTWSAGDEEKGERCGRGPHNRPRGGMRGTAVQGRRAGAWRESGAVGDRIVGRRGVVC